MVPMIVVSKLCHAAWHESGHVVSATCLSLPLLGASIDHRGNGITKYARLFTAAEIEPWAVTVYAGGLAEIAAFGDCKADSDDDVLRIAMRRLNLSWTNGRLAEFRERARALVMREHAAIAAVAAALRARHVLAADEIGVILSGAIPAPAGWVR
jgi:hypothetical protein